MKLLVDRLRSRSLDVAGRLEVQRNHCSRALVNSDVAKSERLVAEETPDALATAMTLYVRRLTRSGNPPRRLKK